MDVLKEIRYFYRQTSLYELQLMNQGDYYNKLSYNSLLYLNIIGETPNCTVSMLAQQLNITKSAVTIKVNELIKQNTLIKTQSDTDKRVHYLTLSPHIEKVMDTYYDIFYKIEKDMQEKYTGEELTLFCDMLRAMSDYNWRKVQNE